MSIYSLRKRSKIPITNIDIFYAKYHFYLTVEKIDVDGETRKCFRISNVNNEYMSLYTLKGLKSVYSSANINNNEIRYNYNILRECIQPGDVLYSFQESIFSDAFYAEHFGSSGEFFNKVLDFEKVDFIFVPLNVYKVLVQVDYKERSQRTRPSEFKKVQQEWDIAKPCLDCKYVFLVSQSTAFRSKCCANGKFIKKSLPQNLFYYCILEENRFFQKNCFIYNNMLALGSLGVDKGYNSSHIMTQGGSVCLQGRTYLMHRRENNTKALVYYTNGYKHNEEEDRIFEDLKRVVGRYNMNGDNNDDISPHVRILNTLRHEQFNVNDLVHEFTSIIDNMQHMTYEELKTEVKESLSVYDVSHYRASERCDPCMHVILKDGKNSHSVVHAKNPYYEAVSMILFY